MKTNNDRKHMFKLGFCLKLAEARVSPHQLVELATKLAKKKKNDGEDSGPSFKAPSITAPLALMTGLSYAIPNMAGSASGLALSKLTDSDVNTPSELRKTYLIKKYKEMIRQRKIRLRNQAINEALRV